MDFGCSVDCPFEIVVTPSNVKGRDFIAGASTAASWKQWLDVRLDDRENGRGVKFKDADLSVPFRINGEGSYRRYRGSGSALDSHARC